MNQVEFLLLCLCLKPSPALYIKLDRLCEIAPAAMRRDHATY